MSSTTNSVSSIMTYMAQSTAAGTTSSFKFQSISSRSASSGFNSILNKTSDTMIQAKEPNVKKDDYRTDLSSKSDRLQNAKDVKRQDQNRKSNIEDDDKLNANESSPMKGKDVTEGISVEGEEKLNSTEADNKLQEAITEKGKELISKIAKKLDINEEDIYNAMQMMGLMAGDLLDTDNLQMVVSEIIGTERTLDLLTDPDLYTSMQDLYQDAESMKSELMNEFSLSEDDIKTAILENNNKYTEFEINPFKDKADIKDLKNPEIVVNEAGDEIQKRILASHSKEHAQGLNVDANSEEINTNEFKPIEEMEHMSGRFNDAANNQAANLFNQFLDNMANATDINGESAVSFTDRAQMENIVRQITEKITISAGEGESSMELQLHPAHLGNVNILLTSTKDGIVAKFTAQNEIVKEAVESQMLSLQQRFDEQGVKVTAIEVTIASHAFEENLHEGDKNQNFDKQGKEKKSMRRINLNEVENMDEEMSEEDLVAAKVMEMNGNSVDYSA